MNNKNEIKIEDLNVPISNFSKRKNGRKPSPVSEAIANLLCGQSILIKNVKKNSIYSFVDRINRKYPSRKFSIRTIVTDDGSHVGVWRFDDVV